MVLIIVLAVGCAIQVIRAVRNPRELYQFEFLVSFIFLSFGVPQLTALTLDRSLPAGALEKTTLMSLLCFGMCILGYRRAASPLRLFRGALDERKLAVLSFAFLGLAAVCAVWLRSWPEARIMGQLTGLPTILLFFFKCNAYALSIAAFCYVRNSSKWALVCGAFSALLYFDRVIIGAKRGDLAEMSFILLLAGWFGWRKTPPRWLLVAGLIGGFVIINGIGAYRQAMFRDVLHGSALSIDADLWDRMREASSNLFSRDTFMRVVHLNPAHEFRTAVYTIQAHDLTGEMNFGASHWNSLIFSFVPGQFVGNEMKFALMFDIDQNLPLQVLQYESPAGVTVTGIATSFASFWYFGCLEFFFIGMLMKRLYEGAANGNLVDCIVYAILLTPALHTVTHSTSWILVGFVHCAAILLPGLYFCKCWPQQSLSSAHAAPKTATTVTRMV